MILALIFVVVGVYSTLILAEKTGFDLSIVLTIAGLVASCLLAIVTTTLSLYRSGPKIKLQFHSRRAEGSGGSTAGSAVIYQMWRVRFTFANEGDTVGRVFDSKISATVTPELSGIIGETRGFGPGNQDDFFVYPDKPITGHVDIAIRPKQAGPSWDSEFNQGVLAGRVSVKVTIEYTVGDQTRSHSKRAKPIILDAESRSP